MFTQTPDSCATSAVAITPADSDLAAPCRALYIGTGGNLKVTTWRGDAVTFNNIQAGTVLPLTVKRVWATGTTASDVVGLGY